MDDRLQIAARVSTATKSVRPVGQPFEIGKVDAERKAGGGVLGIKARHAAIDQQAAKRHDEWLQPHLGDQQTVDQPHHETDDDHHQRRRCGQGTPLLAIKSTKITPRMAIIEPTDNSMPPVMITKPWPMAKMPNRPDQIGGVGDVDRGQEPAD